MKCNPLRFLAIRAGVVLAPSLVRGEVFASDKFYEPPPTVSADLSPFFNHSLQVPIANWITFVGWAKARALQGSCRMEHGKL